MAPKAVARVPPRIGEDLPKESPSPLDEVRIANVALVGDYSGAECQAAEITACRLDRVQAIGSRLIRSRLVDCVAVACDFSGAVLDDCSIRRVEFHDCRLSGLQAQHSSFKDVAFFDCKVDGANFRMTKWESAEFRNCSLVEADFYEASLPGSRFQSCDLTGVQLSKADLTGTRLHGSTLERIQGADNLRGVIIGSDQVIPAALAVFGTLKIVVDDELNLGD
jgi:uncharacterized protein YjbI with pentapeptide repeats